MPKKLPIKLAECFKKGGYSYEKLLILIYVFLGVILFANSFCLASEDKKSFELETENLWNYYQKITQTYSDWKNEQEIELDEIHKKWVQSGINQITSSIENSDKQDFMKFLFQRMANIV